jgi:hypothetical protein
VFAYRLGEYIVIGPMPTPHDEMVFMLANKAINTTQGWLDKSPRTLVADVHGLRRLWWA